jgi:ABC-type antimicrobial peptide transport system permease subunit
MELVFSWSGFVMGAMVLTGVVVMVSILTIRFINKINIADVIRDRSTG